MGFEGFSYLRHEVMLPWTNLEKRTEYMGTINIDEGLAALMAAAAASISAYMNIQSTKTAAHLAAKQSVVSKDLQELSTALYEVVALSVEAMNSKTPDRFQAKIDQATKVSTRLDELRRRHRYSIPFVFDAIWHLKGIQSMSRTTETRSVTHACK